MASVYEIVSQRILEELAKGVVPWRKPWVGSELQNGVTGRAYSGMNRILLSGGATPFWLTKRQLDGLGGRIKSGAKAGMATFWRFFEDENGEDGRKRPPCLRYYMVFNVADAEFDAQKLPAKRRDILARWNAGERGGPPFDAVGLMDEMENAPVLASGDCAAYFPTLDMVIMPPLAAFDSAASFVQMLAHELVHSTGHPSRLGRFKAGAKDSRFGSESYSREELVAEIGACQLCADRGIDPNYANSASYIAGWSKRIKGDPHLFAMAACQAQKAVKYINGENGETQNDDGVV